MWPRSRMPLVNATSTLGMSTDKTSAHKLIALEGEIDLHRTPDVKRELEAAIAEKPAKLMVDLSKVTYIDSSGLATLLEGMQGVEFYGGKFYLVALQETIRPIFETSKLDEVFRIVSSVDAAEAAS
jgi:anti-sigma B factor antagonist